MKPNTPLTYQEFKLKNLFQLACLLAANHSLNWDHLPFAQKYQGIAKQLLIKIFRKCGKCCCLGQQFTEKSKKFEGSGKNGNLEEIADLDFLRTIDSGYMIID